MMKRESERWDYSCLFASPTTSRPHGRAGEFLAFRRRKAGRDPHDNHVMGTWIHRGDELRRLRARSPLRIAEPVFHDPDTGLLFLDEE